MLLQGHYKCEDYFLGSSFVFIVCTLLVYVPNALKLKV
jgi:Na+-transporting methylmalonyl-CoA/oxaloacetate decarboxylase gamma subunit